MYFFEKWLCKIEKLYAKNIDKNFYTKNFYYSQFNNFCKCLPLLVSGNFRIICSKKYKLDKKPNVSSRIRTCAGRAHMISSHAR